MPGIRLARLAALAAVCLLAALNTAAQAHIGGIAVTVKDCTPPQVAFVAKCFIVNTKPAAAISVNLGVDARTIVSTTDRSRLTHNVTIRGLSAGTEYLGTLTVTPKTGKSQTIRLTPFQTTAPGSSPAALTMRGNKILINGSPTLVYMPYLANCPDADTISQYRQMGFNQIEGFACVPPGNADYIQTLQSWLGPTWWHEAQKQQEARLNGSPNLLPWSGSFVGDVFPGITPCQNSAKLTAWFQKTMADTKTWSANKVVLPTIWAAAKLTDTIPNCVNARWMDLVFWGFLSEGAPGLVIDTHQPIHAGQVASINLDPAVKNQIAADLKCAATFGTVAVMGSPAALPAPVNPGLTYRVWKYSGSWYVVAVNATTSPQPLTMKFPGKVNSTALGMCGTAAAKVKTSQLKVTLGALTRVIYRVSPAQK